MDTQEAHFQLLLADRIRDDARRVAGSEVDTQIDLGRAGILREQAHDSLEVGAVVQGIGREVVELPRKDAGPSLSHSVMNPSKVTTKASVERLNLIVTNGVFDLALDAAESVGATTGLEKMLAHQLAAAHKTAMELLARCHEQGDPTRELASIKAAARLMSAFQQGTLALQRLKTGGNQVLTIKHVTVGPGGQAVIGNVKGLRE